MTKSDYRILFILSGCINLGLLYVMGKIGGVTATILLNVFVFGIGALEIFLNDKRGLRDD